MTSLKSLLSQEAGPKLAFLPSPEPGQIAEVLVAFANSEGGTVVLGVGPDGKADAAFRDEEAEGSLRAALMLTSPLVQTNWQQVETPTGSLVVLTVRPSPTLHTMSDGRVLVRSGRENRPLAGHEVQALVAFKATEDFETQMVPGASRSDLDDDLVEEYLAMRRERNTWSGAMPRDRLLQQISALTGDNTPTVSGLLLFGREPQLFLPHCRVIFVNFKHAHAQSPSGSEDRRYDRREEIGGPLANVIKNAYNVVWQEMDKKAIVKGLQRIDQTEYPIGAVREALVNAVCHRDYRLTGRSIEIRMYDDRLEISSPGGLPAHMTLDNLVDEHYSRNPRIVNGLYHWGYIEELGLGVDLMYSELAAHGHPPPVFDAREHRFAVTFQNTKDPSQVTPDWEQDMNERQVKALQYVQENGSITNSDYRQLCSHVGAESLRLDLVDLVNKGLLLKIGDKRGTRYILK